MNDRILVRTYTEVGYQPIPPIYLSDAEYARGLQCFVPACTDIVPIDLVQRTFFLAHRRARPAATWWWTGGKMLPHETKEESAVRSFARETGLRLSADRFIFTAVLDYRTKDRAQEPQTVGCHMLVYTFTIELTPDEIAYAASHLDEHEYERDRGLTAFDRKRIIDTAVPPAIIDLYDHVFPSVSDVESGVVELTTSDARHDIREFTFSDGVFQEIYVHDGTHPFGQHFHREKFETFSFITGSGTVRTAQVDAMGKIIGDVRVHHVRLGLTIHIPPNHAHRFDLTSGSRFVVFCPKLHDASDVIPCSIE